MGAKEGMATAAGTAVLVYLVLSGRLCGDAAGEEDGTISSAVAAAVEARRRRKEEARERREQRRSRRRRRWPERAPGGWGEAAAVAARTVRETYGETLGKWPLGDIAFGIKYYMRLQGNLQHEYAGSSSQLLEGPGVKEEMISLLGYLKLCMYFSKKPYKVFMEFGGYDESDVLIKKSKARLMKPSFTVVRDRSAKCFLLFIRGAISVKDRLTAATGAEVPFHHVVAQDGRVSKLVLGQAHCGMVVAARWIAKQAIPCLNEAVEQFPDYGVKIIGHSMGAGIAAILTYILRENQKLSSSTCLAFGPAACMTWDLAESGKDFITAIVNRNDLVPSFGKVSAAKLRTEVMASSWVHDLREQIQQTRFLGFVNRSVSFIRSHVPFVSDPRSKVVDVDMLKPNSSKAKVKSSSNSHDVAKKRATLACWSCVAAHKQSIDSAKRSTHEMPNQTDVDVNDEKTDSQVAKVVSISIEELDLGDSDNDDDTDRRENEPAVYGKDADQAMELLETLTNKPHESSSSSKYQEPSQLYPPGRILHMVGLPSVEPNRTSEQGDREEVLALYETPRHLYSKIRLAKSMIREHYMPKYIRTMELLIDKFAEKEEDIDNDQLGSL
uniref:Fungal lipase-like domain-containing protein n=1 Tax=Leersia perrieri TaxID=77586 RepID=A0A0D9Y074_9ORYZ